MDSINRNLIPKPAQEEQRLLALQQLQILDTSREEAFDFLTEMAAQICGAPFAFVTLVDADRVWVKSGYGMQVTEIPRDEEYCSWTILESQYLMIPDLSKDKRTAEMALTIKPPGFRMYTGTNLTTSAGFNIGTLCVLDTISRKLDEKQLRLLRALANQAMALIELRAKEKQLAAANKTLEELATTDELTGLQNRRALFAKMETELARSKRFNTNVSVLMVDVDHFKRVNDEYGHAAGDQVLRALGELLRNFGRSIDIAGRYGGEELCLLLPETDSKGALRAAESLREKVAALSIAHQDQTLRISASIGVACAPAHAPYQMAALLQSADEALYRAKAQGRNCVVSAL